MSFTPGPWIAEGRLVYSTDDEPVEVARVGMADSARNRADAALIAAAPDLLAACIEALETLESNKMRHTTTAGKLLVQAIAKAKGQ